MIRWVFILGLRLRDKRASILIDRGHVVNGIAIPHALLDAPFPPEQKLRYFIDDGTVLDYNPGPFLVRDRPNQKNGA